MFGFMIAFVQLGYIVFIYWIDINTSFEIRLGGNKLQSYRVSLYHAS